MMSEKNHGMDDSTQEENLSWEERAFRCRMRGGALIEQVNALTRDLKAAQLDLELSMKYILWIQDLQPYPVSVPQVGQSTSVSETVMMQIEQHIRCSLPSDYRAFISSLGGWGGFGFQKPLTFKPAMIPDESFFVLDIFFGIRLDERFDILRQHKFHQGKIHSDFLPIATAKGGNIICLAVTGTQHGTVSLCRNQQLKPKLFLNRQEEVRANVENMKFIASSFDEFVSLLQN